jgi:hypothetical protein
MCVMTPERSLRPITGKFEDTFPTYHGAGLVGFVLRVADAIQAWQRVRPRQEPAEQTLFPNVPCGSPAQQADRAH